MTTETTNKIDYRTAKGWLKDAEREMLFEHASRLPGNAVILNIGVEFGASLACLRVGNATARIIGLDLDTSKAVSTYGCELRQVDSHEAVKNWPWPLDLIFVDGDHGEAGVLLDAGFADHLPVGGHILFQDCFDYDNPTIIHLVCPGVNAAVDKWFAAHNTEFEELASVETTRIFKRVKEHEQPRVADSGGVVADLQSGSIASREPEVYERKPKVQRGNKSNSR